MTTSDVKVTPGSGRNVATYSITEDAETKELQRIVSNDSAGNEIEAVTVGQGTAAQSVPVVLASDDPVAAATKADGATFTPGADRVVVIGAEVDETSPAAAAEGKAGGVRMTTARGLHVNLRDSTGSEVQATTLGQDVMAASIPVAIASNQSPVAVSGTLTAVTTVGTVTNVVHVDDNAGSLTVDGSVAVSGVGGTVTVAGAVSVDDGGGSLTVDGAVTANAGTNLNTSTLALEAGGNLAAAAASLSVMDDWDSTDAAKVVGITANPTGLYTRPNDTTAYAVNDLVSNNTTAGSITVQSVAAARVAAGSGLIRRCRLTTNHTTGLDGVQIKVRFWSAAPTYTNGDNGAYAVATGAAGYLGSMTVTLEQFADGASGNGSPAVGSEIAFSLGSGTSVFWDMQTLSIFTPQASKTFTLTAETLQD